MSTRYDNKAPQSIAIFIIAACVTACAGETVDTPFDSTTGETTSTPATTDGSSTGVDESTSTGGDTTGLAEESTGGNCPTGAEGCPCYGNATCDEGLSCADAVCVPGACGDGEVQDGEECDDGNDLDDDDCIDCAQAFCGDGFVHAQDEACDDGDDDDADDCTSACLLPHCGDGVVQAGEECDDGDGSDTDDCPGSCLSAKCGDGFVHESLEECDDGNDANDDECLDSCVAAVCGDGFVRAGVEECDDANLVDTDACPTTCLAAECGDSFVYAGTEECDDGNVADDDACVSGCVAATCGDGFVDQGGEDCDGSELGGNDCSTLGQDWTGGPITCEGDCTANIAQCVGELDNTNGNCNDLQWCLAGGPHAQQECFTALDLPTPYTLTEAAYTLSLADAPTTASLEVYTWDGDGPGALLASQTLDPANDFSLGMHSIVLTTPLDIDSGDFCIGLRSNVRFSMSRDAGSSQGTETFIEAPSCMATSFIPVSITGFSGNWCIVPTVVPWQG
jgi:cysteine-rich repeat protein